MTTRIISPYPAVSISKLTTLNEAAQSKDHIPGTDGVSDMQGCDFELKQLLEWQRIDLIYLPRWGCNGGNKEGLEPAQSPLGWRLQLSDVSPQYVAPVGPFGPLAPFEARPDHG